MAEAYVCELTDTTIGDLDNTWYRAEDLSRICHRTWAMVVKKRGKIGNPF